MANSNSLVLFRAVDDPAGNEIEVLTSGTVGKLKEIFEDNDEVQIWKVNGTVAEPLVYEGIYYRGYLVEMANCFFETKVEFAIESILEKECAVFVTKESIASLKEGFVEEITLDSPEGLDEKQIKLVNSIIKALKS